MIDENNDAFGAPVLSASMDTGEGVAENLKGDASWKPPLTRLKRFTQQPKENVTCYEEDKVCDYIECDENQLRADGSLCTKEYCTNEVCGKKTCTLMFSSEDYEDVTQYESCPIIAEDLRDIYRDSLRYAVDTWCRGLECAEPLANGIDREFNVSSQAMDYMPYVDAAL